jgi:hypothetical protein
LPFGQSSFRADHLVHSRRQLELGGSDREATGLRSAASALHAASILVRYTRDWLAREHITRLVLGPAMVGLLAQSGREADIELMTEAIV